MPLHNPLKIDLTVITATCRRPAQMASCLSQFRSQSLGDLRCEHLVVSNAVDPQARGQYVGFWDDDNLYEPHALARLARRESAAISNDGYPSMAHVFTINPAIAMSGVCSLLDGCRRNW
jgi:hypothetical protein